MPKDSEQEGFAWREAKKCQTFWWKRNDRQYFTVDSCGVAEDRQGNFPLPSSTTHPNILPTLVFFRWYIFIAVVSTWNMVLLFGREVCGLFPYSKQPNRLPGKTALSFFCWFEQQQQQKIPRKWINNAEVAFLFELFLLFGVFVVINIRPCIFFFYHLFPVFPPSFNSIFKMHQDRTNPKKTTTFSSIRPWRNIIRNFWERIGLWISNTKRKFIPFFRGRRFKVLEWNKGSGYKFESGSGYTPTPPIRIVGGAVIVNERVRSRYFGREFDYAFWKINPFYSCTRFWTTPRIPMINCAGLCSTRLYTEFKFWLKTTKNFNERPKIK